MRARAPPRIPPDGWPTTQPTTRIGLESLAFKATTDPIHVLQENYGIPRTDANTLLPDWKQPSYYTMANILSLQSVVSGWSCKRAYSLPCTSPGCPAYCLEKPFTTRSRQTRSSPGQWLPLSVSPGRAARPSRSVIGRAHQSYAMAVR